MSLKKSQILHLLNGWVNHSLTDAEEVALKDWVLGANADDAVFEEFIHVQLGNSELQLINEPDWAQLYEKVKAAAFKKAHKKKTISIKYLWRVAAIFLLVIGLGVLLMMINPFDREKEIPVAFSDIKAPESNLATLTLGDGRTISLDSLALLTDSGYVFSNGDLVHNKDGNEKQEMLTLFNPRGSRPVRLKLSDGSEVFLNAFSSITYPNVFKGTERRVELKGEAYFEVSHNKQFPFKVFTNKVQVEVLGTHFNVMAYDDEPGIKTTLLQGAVKVIGAGTNPVVIKPGQQAYYDELFGNINIKQADLEEVMAWKNGQFVFNNEELESVMRKISRWYNVDVEYKGNIENKSIWGSISRDENISQVLKMLELTGIVHFKIQNGRIIVMP